MWGAIAFGFNSFCKKIVHQMRNRKNKFVTITTVGFALFAMFFGAGNLILPPFIGLLSGNQWTISLSGFFITAIIAPFLGVLVVTKSGMSFTDLGKKVHPTLINILALLIILCIGPLVAIPRTGATTFEVGFKPFFPELSNIVFALLFFGVVFALSISKTKIVDIIGKFLTPVLLLSLFILIFLGIFFPVKPVSPPLEISAGNSFSFGFVEGYQTLDVLASVIFAGIIISAVVGSGYTGVKERVRITISAGIISTLALLIIYGGLIYLGATSNYLEANAISSVSDISRVNLLLHISNSILGKAGTIIMAVAIAFACLTTAIALTSATGSIFEKMSKGKFPYRWGVTLCTVVSVFLSINGVDNIITYAVNILLFIYPIVFTLILCLLLFGRFIETKMPYIAAIIATTLISIVSVAKNLGLDFPLLFELKDSLPLSSYHLEWLTPSLATFVVFAVFSKKKY